jgi:hypothetical protein
VKKALLVLVVLTALAGGGFGVKAWRAHTTKAVDERAFIRAEMFLSQGRPIEALAIHQYHSGKPGSSLDWAGLEFRALVAQVNLPRLTSIYLDAPSRVLASEEGSITVARAFLHLRQPSEFETIRERWRGRETDLARWILLDADRHLLEGLPGKAEALLLAHPLPGTNDAPRLLRLALIKAGQAPREAFQLLNAAAALAPQQPDTRVFRGQVLEALGRTGEARVEYVAAVVAAPQNPIWRDQLAEFYRRTASLDLALATWQEALAPPSLDAIWLKTTFWSRMLQNVDFHSISNPPPPGRLAPLVAVLQSQPAGRFLETNALNELPAANHLAAQRPELFWLQLADLLLRREESKALALLTARAPTQSSWAPELERALVRILAFRATGQLTPTGWLPPSTPASSPTLHTYFASLESAARNPVPPEAALTAVLKGDHACAAAFLAAGWREAALTLANPEHLAPDSPDWLIYGFAQALRFNRTPEAALALLAKHPAPPILALLAAELQLAEGRRTEGLTALQPLADADSDVGYRASWLLALDALDQGTPGDARRILESQARLAKHLTGQELLARIHLAEGATNEAHNLYLALAPRSVEARAYLARTAATAKDWPKARQFTEELIGLLPDSVELRSNLEAIARAENPPTP